MTKQKYQAHTTDYESDMLYRAQIAEDINKMTITVELAHREALEAEAIKRGIDAKLAANGYTPNGEAIKQA